MALTSLRVEISQVHLDQDYYRSKAGSIASTYPNLIMVDSLAAAFLRRDISSLAAGIHNIPSNKVIKVNAIKVFSNSRLIDWWFSSRFGITLG